MSEIIERVARAMEAKRMELIAQPLNRIWPQLARAAIQAMRDPTDAMKVAGGLKCEALMFEGEGSGVIFNDMGEVFTAMIDTALSERQP